MLDTAAFYRDARVLVISGTGFNNPAKHDARSVCHVAPGRPRRHRGQSCSGAKRAKPLLAVLLLPRDCISAAGLAQRNAHRRVRQNQKEPDKSAESRRRELNCHQQAQVAQKQCFELMASNGVGYGADAIHQARGDPRESGDEYQAPDNTQLTRRLDQRIVHRVAGVRYEV